METGSSKKRKFLPNISKAQSKKSNQTNDTNEANEKKVSKQANRKSLKNVKKSGKPQSKFVQSYSIFETGVGVFEKNKYERDYGSSTSVSQRKTTENSANKEIMEEMEDRDFEITSAICDIKQDHRLSPILMRNTEDEENDLDENNEAKFCQFLTSNTDRDIFCMRVSEKIFSPDHPSGFIGKMQVLSNGETRLNLGDSTFQLVSSRPEYNNYELIRIDDTDQVHITCLGYPNHFLGAVPQLDDLEQLGN
ncbi:hypothetical protein Ciccas_004340 [Cichlidogyrus casuarinus]|uniref:Uncharacterized protein n=1 Tax=Cichlidogyrus casuarinus TaxID=1844966 RepID=A0ABD2QBQ9_9PLAT